MCIHTYCECVCVSTSRGLLWTECVCVCLCVSSFRVCIECWSTKMCASRESNTLSAGFRPAHHGLHIGCQAGSDSLSYALPSVNSSTCSCHAHFPTLWSPYHTVVELLLYLHSFIPGRFSLLLFRRLISTTKRLCVCQSTDYMRAFSDPPFPQEEYLGLLLNCNQISGLSC